MMTMTRANMSTYIGVKSIAHMVKNSWPSIRVLFFVHTAGNLVLAGSHLAVSAVEALLPDDVVIIIILSVEKPKYKLKTWTLIKTLQAQKALTVAQSPIKTFGGPMRRVMGAP